MNPKQIARQIRPLIGLNAQQAQANFNYRMKVYNRYMEGGASIEVATSRAEKAALRYASKQHRFRAETITHTELAFAYNQGAHVGVQRAISRGSMSRCAMVWTTAGTNRVCPRCLPLKGKVVGYTDEAGVQIPPLHPRCRCVIDYREVGDINTPNHNSTVEGFVPRSPEEAKRVANKLNPVVGKYFVRKSKWNGQVVISKRGRNSKNPNCSIEINPKDCPDEALLHELVHAHSTSYYSNELYIANSALEEASVQYLTQEIAKAENINLVGCGYDYWVDKLREINREFSLYESDLKFAQRLLRVPMTVREEWLLGKVRKSAKTIEQMMNASELLSKLTWEALENESD